MRRKLCAYMLVLCAVFVIAASSACRKIQNPMPSDLKRTGFLFNYRIENPQPPLRRSSVPVARRFPEARLRIFSRTDLVPAGVIESYIKRSGARVEIATYDTNPEMARRITQGEPFDLVFGPGYMVQIMAQRGELAPLNYANIPNIRHVAFHFRSLPFDPENRYSVALVWHTLGIAYNAGLLDETPHLWKNLFEPSEVHRAHVAGRSALIASPYRIFAVALLQLGFDPNSRDPRETNAAADFLRRIAPQATFQLIPQHELAARLADEDVVIAMAHSSDVTRAAKTNPDVAFAIPEDGTIVSFDTVAMLQKTNARQRQIAEDFINFLLHPTVAAELANTALQASTEPAAAPYLSPAIKFGPSGLRPRDGWVALTGDASSTLQEEVYAQLAAAQPATP